MSEIKYLTNSELPFCKGCGHILVTRNCEKALAKLGYNPLDVVLVTDIGCHGIIDKSFITHTVHGIHGRSLALAGGISMAINSPEKKIIVFIGDGGATIGMQHLIGCAHYGMNITVIVHNNMLYGMTGGQPSEFTPCGFKTPAQPGGSNKPGYDICNLVSEAGSSYTERVLGVGDYSDSLAKAFSIKGFSLVEVMEICTSYGVKSNPGFKLAAVVKEAGLDIKVFNNIRCRIYLDQQGNKQENLISEMQVIEKKFNSNLNGKFSIQLSGSAGEGIQSATEFLAKAAMKSGMNVTKKGSYPVTVGVGYSSSDLIISPGPIQYTGITRPDVLIITSQDGLAYSNVTARQMKLGRILIDDQLVTPESGAEITKVPFRNRAGNRYCALYSLFWFINSTNIIPREAMLAVFHETNLANKISLEKLLEI
jgi:2-oxoglutarate/2-oxoacid ferredoxin oxidoreductase subunit beta